LVDIYDFYQSKKNTTPRKFFLKKLYYLLSTLVISLFFFIYALIKYDVFIFGFGSSFFPKNIDLFILKFFGKTIISNLGHGSEARPIYINGFQSFHKVNYMIAHAKKMSKKIQFIEKNSSMVIASPLSSHYIKGPYINFLVLGIPYYKKNYKNYSARKLVASVRVLHAPSHPAGKGSVIIRDAINSLKNKGYLINVARGSVVDQTALIEALQKKVIGGAALDVYADEPRVPAELRNLQNVVLTPHVASATVQTRQAMAALALANLNAHFEGQAIPALVPEWATRV
jgi:hypothetical protein